MQNDNGLEIQASPPTSTYGDPSHFLLQKPFVQGCCTNDQARYKFYWLNCWFWDRITEIVKEILSVTYPWKFLVISKGKKSR